MRVHCRQQAQWDALHGSNEQPAWSHPAAQGKHFEGFTKRYGCKMLVWFEPHETMEAAITREKQIKEWRRAWKLRLIEDHNPDWDDLYESLL
jgi:putative endonuclease